MMADVKPRKRLLPIVLTLSLALNLAVVAAVGGAWWRHQGHETGGPRAGKGGAIYMQALPKEMRRSLRERSRGGPRARFDAGEMVAALRSDPFEPNAAAAVLETQRDMSLKRLNAMAATWLELVTQMSTQERNAYADRLQMLDEKHKSRRSGN